LYVRLWPIALLGLAGCPGGPSSPPASRHSCTAFVEEQRAVLAAARAQWTERPELSDVFGACISTARGAWGISLDYVEPPRPDHDLAGRFSLVHLAPDGHRVAVGPAFRAREVAGAGGEEQNLRPGLVLAMPVLFDFDGDGEQEIFLRMSLEPDGLEARAVGRIWTYREHEPSIERWEPAREIDVEAVRDVDGDGRPDLLTYDPWEAFAAPGDPCAPMRAHGPLLVVHALVGAPFLSRQDAVARAAVKDACPGRPAQILRFTDGPSEPKAIDASGSLQNLACARLRGVSAGEVKAEIENDCAGTGSCSLDPICGTARWLSFADLEPPLVVP
jgi:hypothetical protein